MREVVEKYVDNPEFLEFLGREFDKTAVQVWVEELAEFAFGSMDEAVKAFEEHKRANDTESAG